MKKIILILCLSLFTSTAIAGDFLVIFLKDANSYSEKFINLKQVAYAEWSSPSKNGKPGLIRINFTGSKKDIAFECKDEKAMKRIMKALKKGSDDTVNASQCL